MSFITYVWVICFISVYVTLFWILVVSLFNLEKKKKLSYLPLVSIGIPVWNEGKSIVDTLESLDEMDYPKEKLEIIVIDDGSNDDTYKLAKEYARGKKYIKVLKNKSNLGKSETVNRALSLAKGEYFAVCDADSSVDKKLLKDTLVYFTDDNVAAVTTQIKVKDPKNIIERMQRVEMIFASYIRKMMALIGTLHYTNGVMSVFKKDILKKVGGLSNKVMTEDLEIAMRLKSLGYEVKICENAFGHTKVPNTFKGLWIQRVRWFRGYIQTCLLHRRLLGNKKHGLLGLFQLPMEILMLMLMLVSAVFMLYQFLMSIYQYVLKFIVLKWEMFYGWKIPTFSEFIFGINFKLWFPIIVALIMGLYLYMKAHKHSNEKWKYWFSSFSYLFLYPIIRGLQWWHAVFAEVFQTKRRWR